MNSQKKRNGKLLSILLVLCMVLSVVPITAFAGVTDVTGGGTSTSYQHKYQEYATDFILEHPVSAVFLDMGLGKSVINSQNKM